jgi:hypothetical protein
MPVSLLNEAASIMILVNLKLYGGEFRDRFMIASSLGKFLRYSRIQEKNFEPHYPLLSQPS